MSGKDDGDYDSPTSRDETSDFPKRKKREEKKIETGQKKRKAKEKKEKGQIKKEKAQKREK